MESVKQYISNAPLSQKVIEKDHLKLEAPSNLTCFQVKYLRMITVKGMLSTESVSYIQEHVKHFLHFLGGSDEGAGISVISDNEDKENDESSKKR